VFDVCRYLHTTLIITGSNMYVLFPVDLKCAVKLFMTADIKRYFEPKIGPISTTNDVALCTFN